MGRRFDPQHDQTSMYPKHPQETNIRSKEMVRLSDKSQLHSPLGRMFSIIDYVGSPIRFLIMDCPAEATLGYYLAAFEEWRVSHVVRCCQPTYSVGRLQEHQIMVTDLPFKDGGMPPPSIVCNWLELIRNISADALSLDMSNESRPTIAVHCVAGLGRAPVLVAIALIEAGMAPLDAIGFIRSQRRGAFNKPQIAYLDHYKRMTKVTSRSHSFCSSLGRMLRISKPADAVPQQT